MPRPTRHQGRHGQRATRGPRVAPPTDPVGSLRALVQEAIIAAAAMNARDDLDLAAASTQRLGALTSGMWRALSRELATAADRLDASNTERMDDIERRARTLQVDVDEVVAAGVAAMHLDEHRARLETLLEPGTAQRLLGPDMLFGFTVDASGDDEEEDDEDDEDDAVDVDDPADDLPPGLRAVRVAMWLWPAPLTPAWVAIAPSAPSLEDGSTLEPENVSLDLGVLAPPALLDALSTASEIGSEQLNVALTTLAVACWSAHQLDEQLPDDDEDEEEDTDDDVAGDGGAFDTDV